MISCENVDLAVPRNATAEAHRCFSTVASTRPVCNESTCSTFPRHWPTRWCIDTTLNDLPVFAAKHKEEGGGRRGGKKREFQENEKSTSWCIDTTLRDFPVLAAKYKGGGRSSLVLPKK